MKTFFALLGLLAFVLVLLTKPFEFLETYSVHAGHAVHAIATDAGSSDVNVDGTILKELDKVSDNSFGFRAGFWLSALGFLGMLVAVLSYKRKHRKNRKRGLV